MVFYWDLALVSLTGGIVLLISAYLSRRYERTVFAPATAMLLTWGMALVTLSFLPIIGFYHLAAETVLLYVFGAGWFALVALLTSWVLNNNSKKGFFPSQSVIDKLNYRRAMILWMIIAVITYPLALLNIFSYGNSIVEISYNIRVASVAGESILNPVISNLFVVAGLLINIALLGVIKKKVPLKSFLIFAIPFLLLSLIISGRSGLVSLTLGWLVIISIFSGKLNFKALMLPVLFLFSIIYLGGVFVKKFDVEGKSLGESASVLAEHIFGYLYQGPILFSRYFNNEIDVTTNWDFFNSACHIFFKFSLCTPLEQHSEFENYGPEFTGNVYSIYFSIIPHYGLLGLFAVFMIYAIFLSILFYQFKLQRLYALAVYPLMFSAIVLSVFKDSIGYSFYWFLKVLIITFALKIFLKKRRIKINNTVK